MHRVASIIFTLKLSRQIKEISYLENTHNSRLYLYEKKLLHIERPLIKMSIKLERHNALVNLGQYISCGAAVGWHLVLFCCC